MVETFEEMERVVLEWAESRGILRHRSAAAQMDQTAETVHEILNAVARDNPDTFKIGAGNVLVSLVILNYLFFRDRSGRSPTLTHCMALAYDEIKDRAELLPINTRLSE